MRRTTVQIECDACGRAPDRFEGGGDYGPAGWWDLGIDRKEGRTVARTLVYRPSGGAGRPYPDPRRRAEVCSKECAAALLRKWADELAAGESEGR